MVEDDGKIWRMTAVGRAMLDLEIMLDNPPHDAFLRSRETIKAMHEEQKRLGKLINIYYLITAALAFFVIYAGPKSDAKLSLFGLEAPLSILPQQVIAVFMTGVYGIYAINFASYIMLSLMISHVLKREGQESWQFLAAPFDASQLWGALLAPKQIGYGTPKRMTFAAFAVAFIPLIAVAAHSFIVGTATVMAVHAAAKAGGPLSLICAALSVVMLFGSLFAFVGAFLWRVPYRWPADAEPPVVERA